MQLYANIVNYYKISRFDKLPVNYFKLACRHFPYLKVFSFCIVKLVDSHLNAIIATIRLHASITKKIFFIAKPLEAYSWAPPHERVSDGAPHSSPAKSRCQHSKCATRVAFSKIQSNLDRVFALFFPLLWGSN